MLSEVETFANAGHPRPRLLIAPGFNLGVKVLSCACAYWVLAQISLTGFKTLSGIEKLRKRSQKTTLSMGELG